MRPFTAGAAAALLSLTVPLQADEPGPGHSIVIGASRYLAAGADAIRAGDYDEGIRLTSLGLERNAVPVRDRAAGLANLCAAHVSKEEPDKAIPLCTRSLELYSGNWRVYSNRSHAYLQKGMYRQAARDHEIAAAMRPNAAHVRMIGGLLNERTLAPHITMEEEQ